MLGKFSYLSSRKVFLTPEERPVEALGASAEEAAPLKPERVESLASCVASGKWLDLPAP